MLPVASRRSATSRPVVASVSTCFPNAAGPGSEAPTTGPLAGAIGSSRRRRLHSSFRTNGAGRSSSGATSARGSGAGTSSAGASTPAGASASTSTSSSSANDSSSGPASASTDSVPANDTSNGRGGSARRWPIPQASAIASRTAWHRTDGAQPRIRRRGGGPGRRPRAVGGTSPSRSWSTTPGARSTRTPAASLQRSIRAPSRRSPWAAPSSTIHHPRGVSTTRQ